MVLVPRVTTGSVQATGAPALDQELRTSDTSAAFGAIGANSLLEASDELDALAQKEVRAIEERDKVRMMTEISEFEIDSIQRVNTLEQEGTGDQPFVKGVMTDVNTRATDFLNTQPQYLQAEAAIRLLPVKTKVAQSAIATQERKLDEENRSNADLYLNNMINQVRFGQKGEELAIKQAHSFVDNLPQYLQDIYREKAVQEVRTASLKSQLEASPEAAVEAIEAGKFNDIPSSTLEPIYSSGVRAIEAQKNANTILEKKAQGLVGTDPAQAGLLSLQAQGIAAPSRQELLDAQARLGVPEADRSVLTKDQAQTIVRQLSAVQSVDEFLLKREEVKALAEQSGGTVSEIVEDVSKLGNMPMALRLIIDSDPQSVPQEFMESAIDLIRNPKAGEDARKSITDRQIGQTKTATEVLLEVNSTAIEGISDEMEAMVKSGVSVRPGEGTTQEFAQSMKDIAAIVYNKSASIGEDGVDAIERMIRNRNGLQEVRVDNADGYVLPLDIAEVATPDDMFAMKQAVLSDKRVVLPVTGQSFPTEEVASQTMLLNAGWTMYGNQALILRSFGQPVYRRNDAGGLEPITISFDQLALRKRKPDISIWETLGFKE